MDSAASEGRLDPTALEDYLRDGAVRIRGLFAIEGTTPGRCRSALSSAAHGVRWGIPVPVVAPERPSGVRGFGCDASLQLLG